MAKYRVRIKLSVPYSGQPYNEYFIQKHTFFGWANIHNNTTRSKEWAEQTCEELNTLYKKNRQNNTRIKNVESKIK